MVTPDQAIDTIRETGGAQPGYRALHAKGKLYRGTFTATAEAAATLPRRTSHRCGGARADPVLQRLRQSGAARQCPGGSRDGGEVHAAGRVDHRRLHPDREAVPGQHARRLRLAAACDAPGPTAPLRLPDTSPPIPRFLSALPVVRDANKVPASYGTVAYHGLHAFRWIAADGSARFVRYHLQPAAGEEFLSPDVAKSKGADFLIDELDERLASQPVRFEYQVQIAAHGDSTVDPSKPWHSTQTVTVGTLEITGVETEREHGGDIVVFDPMRVTDGIEPSDDPVLRFRTLAYSASVKLRTGVERGPEAPAT